MSPLIIFYKYINMLKCFYLPYLVIILRKYHPTFFMTISTLYFYVYIKNHKTSSGTLLNFTSQVS